MSDLGKTVDTLSSRKQLLYELLLQEKKGGRFAEAEAEPPSGLECSAAVLHAGAILVPLVSGVGFAGVQHALGLPAARRLDVPVLERAWGEILRRHAVLGGGVPARDGQPTQIIRPWQPATVPVTNLAGLPHATRETELLRLAQSAVQTSFDLAAGPIFRVSLFRLGPADHVFCSSSTTSPATVGRTGSCVTNWASFTAR